MIHVTVGYPPKPMMQKLAISAERNGFESHAIPQAWTRPRISTLDKFQLLQAFIWSHALDDNGVLLFTDAYDVLILKNASIVLERFRGMECDILFNAERELFPASAEGEALFPIDGTGSTYRYLNSGCYIGYVWAVKLMLRWCLSRAEGRNPVDHGLDQMMAQDFYAFQRREGPLRVELDRGCRVFTTLHFLDDAVVFDGSSVATALGTTCVVHANGAKTNLGILDELYALLGMEGGTRPPVFDLAVARLGDGRFLQLGGDDKFLSATETASEDTVFSVVTGRRFRVLFTQRAGVLTFHPGTAITTGAGVVAEWELVSGSPTAETSHGFPLSDCVLPGPEAVTFARVPLALLQPSLTQAVQQVLRLIAMEQIDPAVVSRVLASRG